MSRIAPVADVVVEESEPELAEPGLWTDLITITKARLSLLVIITTFLGVCMASGSHLDWMLILDATLGTALAAAAAGVLNQVMEVKVDRLMDRTRHRPLPAGRWKRSSAIMLGVGLAVVGVAWLWIRCNAMSAYLAAATVIIYLAFYTPLKRKTSFCTIVGAVSGALPPVIGWTAARPSLDLGAWVLFGILFTWQMPHFLAIAWMYRDEYAQAGFVMLNPDDTTGAHTAATSLWFTLGLVFITMIPFWTGMVTTSYLLYALLIDTALTGCALRFLVERTRDSARTLFFASIIYLPLILGLMVLTKA